VKSAIFSDVVPKLTSLSTTELPRHRGYGLDKGERVR